MSSDLTTSTLNLSNDNEEQTLNNIQQLQQMEKNLYTQLESISANSGSAAEQEKIIKRINELSQMRMTMFGTLTNTYDRMLDSVSQTRVDLVDQLTVVGVVENELNNAKQNLNKLQDAKNNKMRMVEINTYYGQRYQSHTNIMKLIIVITIPLLILAILNKKQLLPTNIINIITGIILVIGVFLLIRQIYDLYKRDNMNYDEYDWKFNPNTIEPTVYEYDKEQLKGTKIGSELSKAAQNLADNIGLGCVGASCCSGNMTYDETKNKCIENTELTSNKNTNVKENFNVNKNVSYIIPNINIEKKEHITVKAFNSFKNNYATV